jgi:6-phosphogluconolactonase
MTEGNVIVLPDPEALAQHVAGWLTDLAASSKGRFAVALSGGSTPKRLYEILAAPPLCDRFPWSRTHLFFGDERMVGPDDGMSNLRMVRHALLDHVSVPPGNFYPMPTDRPPEEGARAYQATLQTYYGCETLDAARPLFDVVLLGLGENGHTASLFPGTASLDEAMAWVASVTTGVPQPRLTLTYPALASSAAIAFLVAGASKAGVLSRVLAGDRSQPAARVTTRGSLIWFTDSAAAKELDHD